MKLIKIIPGPLLVFLGAFCLSFGGLIVKSFESTNLWQILFWRQIFFATFPLHFDDRSKRIELIKMRVF